MTAHPTGPLPREFVGLTRQAFAAIDHQHKALIAATTALPRKVVEGIAFCDNTKRRAAIRELDRRMPTAPHTMTKRCVVYRSVRSCKQPLSDHFTHDGVEVCWVSVGLNRGTGNVADRPASLFVGMHAAGRLLQRSSPIADIQSTILEAHDALLSAPEALLLVMEQHREWTLPTATGGFVCDCHVVRDMTNDTHLYLRANTYLEADMMAPDQRAQCEAMRFRDGGVTLGDGLCQPPQLRGHIHRETAW